MTKTYVSLAALSFFMAACSAAALPNAAPVAAPAPASPSAPAPVVQAAPVAAAPALIAPPKHEAAAPMRESAAPRASLRESVSCEVRVRPSSNGMLIQAVAHANRAINGDYELVITKSGGGGSSDVTQSGPFTAAAGESVTLGSTELGADGRYRAVLTLRDAAGEVCRLERRS
jgi:hypothetical protein